MPSYGPLIYEGGRIGSYDPVWNNARAGSNLHTGSTPHVDNDYYSGDYYADQSLLAFDTTSIPANETVTSALLYMPINSESYLTVNHFVRCRTYDWVSSASDFSPSESMFVPADEVGNYTLVDTQNVYGVDDEVVFDVTSGIVKEGWTSLLLHGQLVESATHDDIEGRYFVSNSSPPFPNLVVQTEIAPSGPTTFFRGGGAWLPAEKRMRRSDEWV